MMQFNDIYNSTVRKTPQPNLSTRESAIIEATDYSHYVMSDSWNEVDCIQDEENGFFEALAMVFGIAIFFTNLIVVAAIQQGGRKLHKATFCCICNLAIADMFAGLLLLWVFGLQRVVLPFRTARSELAQKSAWTLTVWTSLMSQVVIAIDRYSHVTRGSADDGAFLIRCNNWGNRQRRRMVTIGIASTWLIPTFSYVIPVMTFWNCAGNCLCYVRDNNTEVIYMTCHPTQDCSQVNPPFTKTNMLFLSLVLLLLPPIPIILYMRIFCFVRNSSKNLCPSASKSNSHAVTGSCTENEWRSKRGIDESRGNYWKDDSSASKTEPFISTDDDKTSGATDGGHSRKSWKNANKNGKASPEVISHGGRGTKQFSGRRNVSKNNALRKRSQRRDMRLLRTLVIILTLFLVSTVPLGVLFMVSVTETDKRYVPAAKYLLTLSLLNSLINPWIYFWRFQEMRSAITKMFCSSCSKSRRSKRREEEGKCVCCHIPQLRKPKLFSSQRSTKKATSSSSSSAF